MEINIPVHYLLIFFLIFTTLPKQSSPKTTKGSFSIDLIHRSSHVSPFHDSTATISDHAKWAFHHSHSRLLYFQSTMTTSSLSTIGSPVSPSGDGEYLMKLSLGSPPFEFFAILDTGSDLIWTQCLPCINCYEQVKPIFDPSKSTTYTNLSCNSPLCKALDEEERSCGPHCQYSYVYGDKSFTNGDLAAETFTLLSNTGRPFTTQRIGFGCGHNNGGIFGSDGAGLVGLGGGPLSLVSQLGSLIGYKFSYCLAPKTDNGSSSLLHFGEKAIVVHDSIVSIPLIRVAGQETFYYVTLDDISVGRRKLKIPPGTFHFKPYGKGGLIVDSGTTFTFLNTVGYDRLVSMLKKVIKVPRGEDPDGNFDLCYAGSLDGSKMFPAITFHFSGGDLVLGPKNTFSEVGKGVVCLAMLSSDGVSILGNLAQQNYHVGYDLDKKTVTFASSPCSKV